MTQENNESSWLSGLLENRKSKTIEYRRRQASLLTMATLGISILSVLLALNYQQYPELLTQILAFSNFSLMASLAYFFYSKNIKRSGFVVIGFTTILSLLLIFSGGKEDTGLYWVMFFPLAAFSILGLKWGCFFSLSLFAASAVMLFVPDLIIANYTPVESSRFMLAFCLVSTFSFINEFFRERQAKQVHSLSSDYKRFANLDPLTGLVNRRFLDSEYLKKVATEQKDWCVVLADLDHFKRINDKHGHDVGDLALKHATAVFQETVRSDDLICRYGGEEFLFCLPSTSLENAAKIAEKLRANLEQRELLVGDITLNITCSFGVAAITEGGMEDTIKHADNALYKAKQRGRNRIITVHV